MTYRELQEALSKLSSKELDNDVTIFNSWNDEYFSISSLEKSLEDNSVLDVGHPILIKFIIY